MWSLFAWQMILETMVHLMARHFSCPVEDGVSPRPRVLADIGYSFSPCCHVPLPPRPQAPVWELKGTQRFTCRCHPFCISFFLWQLKSTLCLFLKFLWDSQWKPVQTCPLAGCWQAIACKRYWKEKDIVMSVLFFQIAVINFQSLKCNTVCKVKLFGHVEAF